MFLWCSLPDGVDAAEIARRALADNIVLAPGNAFSLSGTASASCASTSLSRWTTACWTS